MLELLEAQGWKLTAFASAGGLDADDHGPALCEGRIDGLAYAVGHPSANVAELVNVCGARLVPLSGEAVDQIVQWKSYYAHVVISPGTYKRQTEAVPTFGVLATMVRSTRVPADTVYELVKSVFGRLAELRALHPALLHLEPKAMAALGGTAPRHEGALRYFKEHGLAYE